MKITTSDNYSYTFATRSDGLVEVESSAEGIEVMLDTITLSGTTTASVDGVERPTGVQVVHGQNGPSDRRVAVQPGTLAMWVGFEILNYL